MDVRFLCYHDQPQYKEGNYRITPGIRNVAEDRGVWKLENGILTLESDDSKRQSRKYYASVAALLMALDEFVKKYSPSQLWIQDRLVKLKPGDSVGDILYRLCPFSTKISVSDKGDYTYTFGPHISAKNYALIDLVSDDTEERFEHIVELARKNHSGEFMTGKANIRVVEMKGSKPEVFISFEGLDVEEAICAGHGVINSKNYAHNMKVFKGLHEALNRRVIHVEWGEKNELLIIKGVPVTSVLRAYRLGVW